MTDMETIHYNLAAGESAVRDIQVLAMEESFSDINQVASAEESLCQIIAEADNMSNYIISSMDNINLVIAAKNDPNQLVANLLDGCNNLRSDAQMLYNAIASRYQYSILDDNQVTASQQPQQYVDNSYAQNYLNSQVTANRNDVYGDVNAITASQDPQSLFNFFAN